MSAPTDLEDLGYGRGKLRSAPAQSIRRLDVRLGRPVDINRAYADYNQQMQYYAAYQRYLAGGPWAPLALHPDKSWHCKGMAVDTDDGPNYGGPLTRAIWREYGWLFEVATEDWHGQYYTSLDKHYGEPAGDSSTPFPVPTPPDPAPIILEDTTMFRAKSDTTGNWYIIGEFTVTRILAGLAGSTNHQHAIAYNKSAGVSFPTLTSAEIKSMMNDAKKRAVEFFTALGNSTYAKQLAADIDALVAAES